MPGTSVEPGVVSYNAWLKQQSGTGQQGGGKRKGGGGRTSRLKGGKDFLQVRGKWSAAGGAKLDVTEGTKDILTCALRSAW